MHMLKCNGNLFLDSKTVKNRENFEFSKFPQQSILTIENTQISTDPSVSDRYLQDLCHHVRGIPACAALSPNISAKRTFDAITQNLAVRQVQISARRGTRRVGGKSSAKNPALGLADSAQQTRCMHPGCENPDCVTTFAMVHRSDVNKTSPFYKGNRHDTSKHLQ